MLRIARNFVTFQNVVNVPPQHLIEKQNLGPKFVETDDVVENSNSEKAIPPQTPAQEKLKNRFVAKEKNIKSFIFCPRCWIV